MLMIIIAGQPGITSYRRLHNQFFHKSIFQFIFKTQSFNKRKWLELLKDYDMIIDCHLGEANIVVDALSWIYQFSLKVMNTFLNMKHDGSILAELRTKPVFLQRINELQKK
ncbi:integrase [Gossypium australe]|uniref:Integrase n=1 Tax=Gossypium australe TaxID=47621 RepID=A0A5B6WUR3_9ROSI|nr:integrase [Gossypium australe]